MLEEELTKRTKDYHDLTTTFESFLKRRMKTKVNADRTNLMDPKVAAGIQKLSLPFLDALLSQRDGLVLQDHPQLLYQLQQMVAANAMQAQNIGGQRGSKYNRGNVKRGSVFQGNAMPFGGSGGGAAANADQLMSLMIGNRRQSIARPPPSLRRQSLLTGPNSPGQGSGSFMAPSLERIGSMAGRGSINIQRQLSGGGLQRQVSSGFQPHPPEAGGRVPLGMMGDGPLIPPLNESSRSDRLHNLVKYTPNMKIPEHLLTPGEGSRKDGQAEPDLFSSPESEDGKPGENTTRKRKPKTKFKLPSQLKQIKDGQETMARARLDDWHQMKSRLVTFLEQFSAKRNTLSL